MDALKVAGIDEVVVVCVNDGAVMNAWAKDQHCDETPGIAFMGDPTGSFVKALDLELSHPGVHAKGLFGRGKRAAIYFVNGVAQVVRIAEAATDPAGDDFPDVTLAEAMLEAISKHGADL
eukprot:m.71459 g.71459  ORF g.71459 m.71459 type:complete len:120 (-) comp24351_c1_seq1:326-685(-)